MCGSDSPGAILRDDDSRVALHRAIMDAFDRAIPRIPILNWCMNAGTLASCNFSHAPAATAANIDRYDGGRVYSIGSATSDCLSRGASLGCSQDRATATTDLIAELQTHPRRRR
jgi:hypothetical protein